MGDHPVGRSLGAGSDPLTHRRGAQRDEPRPRRQQSVGIGKITLLRTAFAEADGFPTLKFEGVEPKAGMAHSALHVSSRTPWAPIYDHMHEVATRGLV